MWAWPCSASSPSWSNGFQASRPAFTLTKGVGPLSGKTTYAIVGWLVSWGVLALALRGRQVSEKVTYRLTGLLVALGFVLTFPPTWKLLGA